MTGPDDYKCRECDNRVLFRRDHKPECSFYENPYYPREAQS